MPLICWRTDPKYDRAFAVALGSTVVVDTLERARKLIGKYRMVTLEGELLEKSGAMTGGATKKQGGRGFGAAVDDELLPHTCTPGGTVG